MIKDATECPALHLHFSDQPDERHELSSPLFANFSLRRIIAETFRKVDELKQFVLGNLQHRFTLGVEMSSQT
jgi:hypothetical protein